MSLRIVIFAVLVLAVMLVIKDGRIPEKLSVISRCETVATPLGQTGTWKACYPGKIDGIRSLDDEGCTYVSTEGEAQIWKCTED